MSTAIDSLLRLPQVLAAISVSRSAWYAGVKSGIYPPPMKLGARTAVWRTSTIQKLIDSLDQKRSRDTL